MFQHWLIGVALAFVMRQVRKFGETTDWVKVKADMIARVRDIVPGTWFDDEAAAVCSQLVDAVQALLVDKAVQEKLAELLAKEQWAEAGETLKLAVLEKWKPQDEAGKKMLAALENFQYEHAA